MFERGRTTRGRTTTKAVQAPISNEGDGIDDVDLRRGDGLASRSIDIGVGWIDRRVGRACRGRWIATRRGDGQRAALDDAEAGVAARTGGRRPDDAELRRECDEQQQQPGTATGQAGGLTARPGSRRQFPEIRVQPPSSRKSREVPMRIRIPRPRSAGTHAAAFFFASTRLTRVTTATARPPASTPVAAPTSVSTMPPCSTAK